MKKSIYIISILAAGLLLMVYSCSKEEVQTAKSHENDLTPYEIQVHNAIKGFKSTMEMHRENPHYKSGQVVSPDSALWLLEATINFSHAFPNEFYTEHEIEDLTLVIPKTSDGMIDMAVLTQKYDEMKSDITTVYYGSSFTDKGLVLVDLEEDSQTETELILSVQTVTGERGVDPGPGTPGVNGPFGVGMIGGMVRMRANAMKPYKMLLTLHRDCFMKHPIQYRIRAGITALLVHLKWRYLETMMSLFIHMIHSHRIIT
jgi:hypothetical protein